MTTPDQRGYAPENEDKDAPELVQGNDTAFDAAVAADDAAGVTPSANRKFWARAFDDQYEESNRASNADQRAAFEQYQSRPDIESRSSILARENAQPAEFENVVVPNGNFDDAVANTEDNWRPGYVGAFNFEDANGEIAANSNGLGPVEVGEYTAPTFDLPGTPPADDVDPDAPVTP